MALAAQGLARPRVAGEDGAGPTTRQVHGALQRLGVLQIDSVNVLARAHLMPLYSRLGAYDVGQLVRLASRAPRRIVETWAHEASYVPVSTWPLLGWRRREYRDHAWGSIARTAHDHPAELDVVRQIVAASGPVTAAQVHTIMEAGGGPARPPKDNWGWNWSVARRCLELLFFTGEIAAAARDSAFQRRYDLTERVVPRQILAAGEPDDAAAVRGLIEIAARAHGVATQRDLNDYFRIGRGGTRELARQAVADLVDEGTLRPVTVRDAPGEWYLHRDATIPRRAEAHALLSPFDPVVFERNRLDALFDVHYRIEIYVPRHKRVHGYYVLPFLQGEHITARADLKADRPAGTLLVQAVHAEPWLPAGEQPGTAEALARELRGLAAWLGLEQVTVVGPGDLAPALKACLS
ncbi:winged helix-turn-helix domain-containing protein [Myceligenerans crystallogenes]|uniref:Winged helix-turn-helix domain-containing protein n=1 Tax=Myceligenerans crystallogenes TaxID=316335 RepID=A0ABP4ZQ22_9MICO